MRAAARLTLLRRTVLGSWLIAGLLVSLCARAESPTEASETEFTAEVSVGYVLIPVTVRGRQGFVDSLDEEDFEVLVDGQPVEIDSFSLETDAPIDILVLQDLSGSMGLGGKLGYSQRLVNCLASDTGASDAFGLAAFGNGKFWVVVPPASPAREVVDAVSSFRGLGTTALHDAVSWIPELGRAGAGRRATVIVTDGVDNASRVSPEAAQLLLEDAAIPIYTVDLHATSDPESAISARELADRSQKELEAARIEELLRGFAQVSGGRYMAASPRDAAETVCRTIQDDLRRHYLIGFPTREVRSRRQHGIDIRVGGRKARKLALNFRRSYVGGDPAVSSGPF